MALLLKYGSDINAINGCGVSALWLVAARGDLKGAQTRLRAGAGFEVALISALFVFVTVYHPFHTQIRDVVALGYAESGTDCARSAGLAKGSGMLVRKKIPTKISIKR